MGVASSVVTARALGASGKGTLAALSFVTILAIQCALLGLGDAATVRVAQGRATLQRAFSASLPLVLTAAGVGACAVLAYGFLQLPAGDGEIVVAIGIGAATVPVSAVAQFCVFALYAAGRLVLVSVITASMTIATTLNIFLLCAVVDLGVLGATLAILVAALAGLLMALCAVRREGLTFAATVDREYARPALRYGVRTQAATLLAYSSVRVDLLLVYALASQAQAGVYSIAVTLGTLTGFTAVALSYASFRGMAGMERADALAYGARLARAGLAASLVVSVAVVGLTAVLAVPVFGPEFDDVLLPAAVLVVVNALWGVQWVMCRTLAAVGDPRLLLKSFGCNLVVMIGADLATVPAWGAAGAAAGSALGQLAGLVLVIATVRREAPGLRVMLVNREDVRTSMRLARTFAGVLAPAHSRSPKA